MRSSETNGGADSKAVAANGRAGQGGLPQDPAEVRKDAAASAVAVRAPRRMALARAAAALAGAVVLVLLALSAGEGSAPATSALRAGEQGARTATLPPPARTPDAVVPAAAALAQPSPEPAILSAQPGLAASSPALAAAAAAGPVTAAAAPAPSVCGAPDAAAPAAAERAQGVLIPRVAATAVGSGYLVQLGVFADPANALKLYEKTAAAGQPALIQSRVVLGPFADRAAAERARKALQAAGAGPGVVIAPERSR